MGMFDWVRFENECPNCYAELKDFQSKDGYCVSEQVKPHKITNFYTSCFNCKAWIEYHKHRDSKKWTRTVSMDFKDTFLHEHTEEFSKKHLKAHTTEK